LYTTFAKRLVSKRTLLSEMPLAILYSYRRCPYAMRARMALSYAEIAVEIREIALRQKPAHMLQVSPKGTVPVLVLSDGTVIDQSLDIMRWALKVVDRDGWLDADAALMNALISENDGAFKQNLDRYKYADRYPQQSAEYSRAQGEIFLAHLESLLAKNTFLLGAKVCVADIAIFPFIRQFAAVDPDWFDNSAYQNLRRWLKYMLASSLFCKIMVKYPLYIEANP